MKKVTILTRYLPQYRSRFYELLRCSLESKGVSLCLIYGDGKSSDQAKKDLIHLSWAKHRPNKIFTILGRDLYWQPALEEVRDSDLIIVEQASKLIINYYLQSLYLMGRKKVAFWGHGKNFQATAKNRLAESIKRKLSKHVSWWFAYNELSKKVVETLGFSSGRITAVQNSIDTVFLSQKISEISSSKRHDISDSLGLKGTNICVYCGGIYPEKRIEFLLESAKLIHASVKDFELIFIGSGVDKYKVEKFASEHSWVHYLGPLFFEEKAEILSISKLMLMPGLVGLVILDAFAAGVPLVTTNFPGHSPEIDYLENKKNGLMTEYDSKEYSSVVVDLLKNPVKHKILKDGALSSANKYTVENMVDNFTDGILSALAS